MKNRLVSVLLVVMLLAGLIWVASSGYTLGLDDNSGASLFAVGKTTINLWYNDDSLTDYLNEVTVKYNESQNTYRVEPELKDGVDYLETINSASVNNDDDMPDIYIISNDTLGKAALAGLSATVDDPDIFADNTVFPETAVDAVTYNGEVVAYPFYFETAALLYNTDYVEELPATILDIIDFANNYNAPETVSSVFNWDVGDIFYNYYFVGDQINVGGQYGDNVDDIDIYNENAIKALQVYQQLNQYFSIDTKNCGYSSVLSDFAAGKTVFTVATSDAVNLLSQYAADGTFTGNYGVLQLPDITDSLTTRGLSVTNCMVVNGYSKEQTEANSFIRYALLENSSDFFDRTGKPLAQSNVTYSDEHMNGFSDAYTDSRPISKMRAASDFWMLLENSFAEVWDGADPNETLRTLDQQTMVQITGDDSYTVESIADPEKIDINAELTGGE